MNQHLSDREIKQAIHTHHWRLITDLACNMLLLLAHFLFVPFLREMQHRDAAQWLIYGAAGLWYGYTAYSFYVSLLADGRTFLLNTRVARFLGSLNSGLVIAATVFVLNALCLAVVVLIALNYMEPRQFLVMGGEWLAQKMYPTHF